MQAGAKRSRKRSDAILTTATASSTTNNRIESCVVSATVDSDATKRFEEAFNEASQLAKIHLQKYVRLYPPQSTLSILDPISGSNFPVPKQRFDDGGWYNDTIINSFGSLLFKDLSCVRVGLSNYFSVEHNEVNVRDDLTPKKFFGNDLNDYVRIILVPVNFNACHWALIVLDIKTRVVFFLDSMPACIDISTRENICHAMITLIEKWTAFSQKSKRDSFLVEATVNCPTQSNSSDCGVFVCWFMHMVKNELLLDSPDVTSSIKGTKHVEITDFRRTVKIGLTCDH